MMTSSNGGMYADELAAPSSFMNFYYNPCPEYVHEETSESSSYSVYSLSDFSDYSPYSTDLHSAASSFDADGSLDESPLMGAEEADFFAPPPPHFERPPTADEQRQAEIERNQQIARLLSPIRKFQEQLHEQQTRRNAENARRKFSLTNGMRQKQKKLTHTLVAQRTTKPNLSVRRWQSEIASKLRPAALPQRPAEWPRSIAPLARPLPAVSPVAWPPALRR
ncbi:hypothetical protein M3Y99_01192200 [Aphelenchoides fujianensis]|nr:hypothetical protein M3Y99_01192200 [Aphelenchoides fujianensis]